MADWSKLPKELLQLISEKLNCEFHELRFRSVCSSWRSSSSSSIPKNHLLNLPSDIPNPIEPTTSNFSLSLSPNTPFSRSLCSSWRSSSSSIPKTHLLSLPSKLPYPSESNNNTPTYPISKRTIFLINPPPNQQQTLNPWLIKIGLDSRGFTTLWNPLSRDNQLRLRFQLPRQFDFSELSIFKLGHEFVIGDFPSGYSHDHESRSTYNSNFMKKVVALHSVLLTIHISGKLAIFQNGDERWMIMPEMPPKPYTDVCVFNGRPIAVDSTGQTVVVGLDFSLDLVAEAVFGGDRKKLLVESDGELLLVDNYSHRLGQFRLHEKYGQNASDLWGFNEGVYEIGIERGARFDVFRLDENQKKWVKLTNLGDRVLFLGKDCAFSAKASDLCMENGNCVIYRDDDYGGHVRSNGLGINVFCLDNQQILPLSDLPGWTSRFWPPPQWTGLD